MAQDLQFLVEQYLSHPVPVNREAVVLAAVPLVRSLVGKLNIPDHPLVSQEDLENTGLLGLLQALDNYDPERGTQFVTHAYWRVRGSLIDYLRSIDVLSRSKRQLLGEAQEAMETLRQMLGAEPEDQDVADYLGIPLSDYHSLLSEAQCRYALSLHDRVGEEDTMTMLDVLPDDEAALPFERIEQASVLACLTRLVAALPERERTIFGLYYIEDLTLSEIGEFFGLTKARISQILGKTMLALQGQLNEVRTTTT